MSYFDLGTWLFILWWGGCWAAYGLSFHTNRDTRMIPMLFGITILGFYVWMHGRVGHWHHWWYAWNMIPNASLALVAWFAPQARARWPLIWISVAGLIVDAVYFGFAYSGHKLPGICYFCAAATIETLQVACMVYFSGPVDPVVKDYGKRVLTFIRTRNWPWTHHKFQRV